MDAKIEKISELSKLLSVKNRMSDIDDNNRLTTSIIPIHTLHYASKHN